MKKFGKDGKEKPKQDVYLPENTLFGKQSK